MGQTSGLPVHGVSDSVPIGSLEHRARDPANRQTGGLPHATAWADAWESDWHIRPQWQGGHRRGRSLRLDSRPGSLNITRQTLGMMKFAVNMNRASRAGDPEASILYPSPY